MMIHIALYEPEIPPNTGNIMRLCANTGCLLHLIHPLGFQLDEKRLRRAGMDYTDVAKVYEHDNFPAFSAAMAGKQVFAMTTKATQYYHAANFDSECVFLFGPESRGLPESLLNILPEQYKLRIPMLPESRSINLANSAAIVVYEALRQNDFSALR